MNGAQGSEGRCLDVWRIYDISGLTEGRYFGLGTHRLAVLAMQLNSKVEPDL